MRSLKTLILSSLHAALLSAPLLAQPILRGAQTPQVEDAVQLFEQHRLNDAMQAFLEVLHEDPANERAHAYVDLIAKEMSLQRRSVVQQRRLEILADVQKRMEEDREDPAPVQKAIEDTAHAEEYADQDRWHGQCEQARMQRDAGHLLPANAIILKLLTENPAFPEAQRELAELQSRIRIALDHGSDVSIQERYALEGFYAYGQADYATALTSWEKARAVVSQAFPPSEVAQRLRALRFEPFLQVAKIEVDTAHRQAEEQALFRRGLALYDNEKYIDALEIFRQLAIQNPDYPLLGKYLVQAEAASEKDRARRLGEQKREQVASNLQQGLSALEKEEYQKAAAAFEAVLKIDPSHSQARTYLVMARAEMERRHDPKAAQMHYETGLIAYASGKLEDAVREWKIAVRMDPNHEKAINALSKAQKELALNRELL